MVIVMFYKKEVTALTLFLSQHQELCSQASDGLPQADLHLELPWFAGSLRSCSMPWHIARFENNLILSA